MTCLIPLCPFYYLLTVQEVNFRLLYLQRKPMQISFMCLNSFLKLRLQNQSEPA